MKLPTNYSLTNHTNIHSNVSKQIIDVKFLLLHNNTGKHLMTSGSFKHVSTKCVYKSCI